jgi:hypothetical protein
MLDTSLLAQARDILRGSRFFALLGVAALLATLGLSEPLRAQTAPEAIGNLVGDDVTVKGAVRFGVENGRSSALLASGSEITVRSGKARIDLASGDVIAVCGPAHFTIIEAGGTFTLALDYGEVHPQLTSAIPLTVYMPLIVATPVAIGQGDRDLTVGLDQAGSLCAITARGAVRIEEQLGGQGMLVPQGGEVSFRGGELNTVRSSAGACSCELLVVADTVKKQFAMTLPLQPPAQPAATEPTARPPAPPLQGDVPIYRISVPLTFDARSVATAAVDPPVILLQEEARLQPQIYFQGDVEPARPPAPAAKTPAVNASAAKKRGPFAKFFGLFRSRRTEARCTGASCGATG